MMSVPLTAVSTPPVQVVEALAGLAITTPAGRLSVKFSAVAPTPLAVLSMIKLSVLPPPTEMVSGEKTLLNAGGAGVGVGVGLGVMEGVGVASDSWVNLETNVS